jgi:predicted membrane channel-forming protein YqfA (hemolysin III family)
VAYVNSVLQPGETVKIIGRLHWTIFARALLVAAVAIILMLIADSATWSQSSARIFGYLGWLALALAVLLFLHAWFRRSTTELSVTTHRVIYKRGFIIRVLGTGQGFESVHGIGRPIAVRNAITAR